MEEKNPLSFHRSLGGYEPSPLVMLKAPLLPGGLKEIYIKDESWRFGLKAFKALGASFAINHIITSLKGSATFCTATDGNHGRAVAWSAKMNGMEAMVFVPAGTSEGRIGAIRNEGATVTIFDGNYDQTCQHARNESLLNNWILVQDTSFEGYEEIPALIMAGYTTIFRELEDSLNALPDPQVDIVFLQAGVGSFAAAAAWYYLDRYAHRRPKIVVVEPVESDGVLESFKRDTPSVPSGSLDTIMAGLNCGIPSLTGWDIIKNVVDAVITVDDNDAMDAMKILYNNEGHSIIAGESGAAGLAGLARLLRDPEFKPVKEHIGLNNNSRILLFNTEGDTDPAGYRAIING